MTWNPYPEGDPLHDAYGKGVNPYTGQPFTSPEPVPWTVPEQDQWRDQARLWDRVVALAGDAVTAVRLAYHAGLTKRPVEMATTLAARVREHPEARELVRLMYQAGLEDADNLEPAERGPVGTSMTATLAALEAIARRKQADAGYIGTTGPRDPANDWPGA